MVEQQTISARQMTIITILFSTGSAILIIPSDMASMAKQDAWIAALVGMGFGCFIIWLFNALAIRFPRMTLVEIAEAVLGKWLGGALMLLVMISLLISGSGAVLYFVGNFMVTQMMPETPIQAFNILYAVIVVIGVRLGLETLARSAEILFPWFILLLVLFFIVVAFKIKPENIQPIMENGIKPLWPPALSLISIVFLPSIVLLMVTSDVNQPKEARKALFKGSLYGGMIITVITGMATMVLGPDLAARSMYASYLLAQKISLGHFLQRIEAIVAAIWLIAIYFRITFYFYAVVQTLAHILRLKDYRPLVLPLGLILVVLSVVNYPNVAYMQDWDNRIWPALMLANGLFFPLLLFVVSFLRKKRTNR
ncbi:GerAB/ArcD/ProY family transporter [Cohnella silvisoli]|uniref:Endospore germination permease n=1 Tax=Cohnella silvisoli TaxID=2873699 RepID=A0ABV1KSD0_9BACL|nr:endospore germination permease [Cohnella silvisoli]MCD9022643.1 endospore germination permease [Cohnella silvisoli]